MPRKKALLESLSFFLIRVPQRDAEEDKPAHPAFTIVPRYHQSRMVRKIADDALAHFATTGDIGRKYLIDHSAGSGKTLSICWLADRLHSLFKPGTSDKLVDVVFIFTDRKSLDTNIREDIEKFTHLKDVVGLARKADDLPRFLKGRKPIIVTTQQKFAWVLEEIEKNPDLKTLRVAFLIDEAHRSQEGKMGVALRVPFRKSEDPDAEDVAEDEKDEEERIAKIIREHATNDLNDGELIEDRFEGDDHRLMIVANKFQTGFDQPLLAGMFLDKPVVDRNAVQTVSRLNRKIEGKQDVVVVDFTNNASAILKAFAKYRKGTPFEPDEPDSELCTRLLAEIFVADVFTQTDARDFVALAAAGTDAQIQFTISGLRARFQAKLTSSEDRKNFVYRLARLVKSFHFLRCFFTYPDDVKEFVIFAEYVGPQLIKQGSVSELMQQIRQTEVVKAAVEYQGEVRGTGGEVKLRAGGGKKGVGPPPKKVSVQDMIDEIRAEFDISDEEALYIRQVTQEKAADPAIRGTVQAHRDDRVYLEGAYRGQVNGEIQVTYNDLARYEELADPKYTDTGGIFDIMAVTVIDTHLTAAA